MRWEVNYVPRQPQIVIPLSAAIEVQTLIAHYFQDKFHAKKWFLRENTDSSQGQLSRGVWDAKVKYEGFYCDWKLNEQFLGTKLLEFNKYNRVTFLKFKATS